MVVLFFLIIGYFTPMDENILKIMNEELLELRQMNRLAQQRLDLQREDLNETKKWVKEHEIRMTKLDESINRHQAGFEVLFRNMQAMEERLTRELDKLKK